MMVDPAKPFDAVRDKQSRWDACRIVVKQLSAELQDLHKQASVIRDRANAELDPYNKQIAELSTEGAKANQELAEAVEELIAEQFKLLDFICEHVRKEGL